MAVGVIAGLQSRPRTNSVRLQHSQHSTTAYNLRRSGGNGSNGSLSLGSFPNEAFPTRSSQHPLYDSGQHETFPAHLGEEGTHLLTFENKLVYFT
jgi:hypothetical protein